MGEVFANLVDGNLKPDFSGGFGATVTMSTKENPTGGKVIQFPPKLWKDIYWWDVYKKGDTTDGRLRSRRLRADSYRL